MEDRKRAKFVLLLIFAVLSVSTVAYASFDFISDAVTNLDANTMTQLFGNAMSHQVTQFTFAFGVAAWLHSGRVKKEIKSQFVQVISSIDGVTQALRQDLSAQAQRIGNIENGMTRLATRVDNLESKKPNQ